MLFSRVKALVGMGENATDVSIPFSLVAAATANATLICNRPCVVTSIHAINVNAAVRYLRLYDSATVPVAGAGTPIRRYGIPGATTGAGFILAPTVPFAFAAGLGITMTTGSADTDTAVLTAGDVILTIEYV